MTFDFFARAVFENPAKIPRYEGVSASSKLLNMKDAITIWRGLLRRTYSAVNTGNVQRSEVSPSTPKTTICRCIFGKYNSKCLCDASFSLREFRSYRNCHRFNGFCFCYLLNSPRMQSGQLKRFVY